MGSIDREKVGMLISEGKKALAELSLYASMPPEDVLGSRERLGNLKYNFIIAIEAAVDICQHICSKLYAEVPESYAKCFDHLRSKGLVNEQLAVDLSELARFRNVLVHLYWGVDNRRVVEKLSAIGTLDKYFRTIVTRFEMV